MAEPYLKIGDISVEWLGHATFRIKSKRTVIYIDPFVLDPTHESADFILLTHEHYDHCDAQRIESVSKRDTVIIGPPSCISKLRKEFRMISPEQVIEQEGIKFKATHAYNLNKPFHQKGSGVGYVIEIGGMKIYDAGDTDKIPEMKELYDENITIALLPIGGTYTMDEKQAAEAVKMINPMYVIPMHYGATPQITLNADPEKFKKLVGNTSEVKILKRKAYE